MTTLCHPPSFTCTVCVLKIPAIKTHRAASLHDGEDLVCIGVVHNLPLVSADSIHQPGGGVTEEIIKPLREVEFVHCAVQTNTP